MFVVISNGDVCKHVTIFRHLVRGIEERGRRLISLCSQAKSREWRAFKMSSDSISEGIQQIQTEIEDTLRNLTDHNKEQLQRLQVWSLYLLRSPSDVDCVQESNSDLASQINKKISELSGLKSQYANRGADWSPDERKEAEFILDRWYKQKARTLFMKVITLQKIDSFFTKFCWHLADWHMRSQIGKSFRLSFNINHFHKYKFFLNWLTIKISRSPLPLQAGLIAPH